MRYLSESDVTQMMGVGYLGEVRQGPDGNLYQYVQGVDGLGNPIGGFWDVFKRQARRLARQAAGLARQYAQQQADKYLKQYAPSIPGGASALTAATPFLKQAVSLNMRASVLSMRHPTAAYIRYRGWRRMSFEASTNMK